MDIRIRSMEPEDIAAFHQAFAAQGWDKPVALFEQYLAEQGSGAREVFVATCDGQAAGYSTLLPFDPHGPFCEQRIPAVCDFNVLEKYQRMGIGKAILDCIEDKVRAYSSRICLGVGLHRGYGPAQRMYVKRGYVPDGSGVWYCDQSLAPYTACRNDDDLVLYMSKEL